MKHLAFTPPPPHYNTLINQTGRSMVEMLGVLAIIGVLSIGGIAGYNMAVDKHRSNVIEEDAKQTALLISAGLLSGSMSPDKTTGKIPTEKTTTVLGQTMSASSTDDGKTISIDVAGLTTRECVAILRNADSSLYVLAATAETGDLVPFKADISGDMPSTDSFCTRPDSNNLVRFSFLKDFSQYAGMGSSLDNPSNTENAPTVSTLAHNPATVAMVTTQSTKLTTVSTSTVQPYPAENITTAQEAMTTKTMATTASVFVTNPYVPSGDENDIPYDNCGQDVGYWQWNGTKCECQYGVRGDDCNGTPIAWMCVSDSDCKRYGADVTCNRSKQPSAGDKVLMHRFGCWEPDSFPTTTAGIY